MYTGSEQDPVHFYFPLPFRMNKRIASGVAVVVGLLAPLATFAAFPTVSAPSFGSGVPATIAEIIVSVLQFPFTMLGIQNNLYVVGTYVIFAIALGIWAYLRRKATLGH